MQFLCLKAKTTNKTASHHSHKLAISTELLFVRSNMYSFHIWMLYSQSAYQSISISSHIRKKQHYTWQDKRNTIQSYYVFVHRSDAQSERLLPLKALISILDFHEAEFIPKVGCIYAGNSSCFCNTAFLVQRLEI